MGSLIRSLLTLFCLTIFSSVVLNAQSAGSDGIKSFKNGDFNAAIQQLEKSNDPIELNYLGKSYEAVNKKKDAVKAYERSLKSGYAIFEKGLDAWSASKTNPSFLGFLRGLKEILTVSVSSAENAVRLGESSMSNEWRLKANALFSMKQLETDNVEVVRTAEVDQKVKLIVRPTAQLVNTQCEPDPNKGTAVRLKVVFHADGRTISVIPYSKWQKGCSESAIEASKQIKFEPAIKDGKPVITLHVLEYGFGP